MHGARLLAVGTHRIPPRGMTRPTASTASTRGTTGHTRPTPLLAPDVLRHDHLFARVMFTVSAAVVHHHVDHMKAAVLPLPHKARLPLVLLA